jgi:non-homologous end joining protein Ku
VEDADRGKLRVSAEKKLEGQPIASAKTAPPSNVYKLKDALRASIKGGQPTPGENRQKPLRKQNQRSRRLADTAPIDHRHARARQDLAAM